MLKFLIILLAWITPGILLFLYLLWISKRRDSSRGDIEAPATQSANSPIAKNDSQELELSQPIAAAPTRSKARG